MVYWGSGSLFGCGRAKRGRAKFVGIAPTSHFAIKADIRAAALEHSEKDLRDNRKSALGLQSALTAR